MTETFCILFIINFPYTEISLSCYIKCKWFTLWRECCNQHPLTFISLCKRNSKMPSKSSKTNSILALESINSENVVNYFGSHAEWEKFSHVYSYCHNQEFYFAISVLIFTLNLPYTEALKQIHICICLKWFLLSLISFILNQSLYVLFPQKNDLNQLPYFTTGFMIPSWNRSQPLNPSRS